MSTETKRTSEAWKKLCTGLTIYDPDGWDRRNLRESWLEPITAAEFVSRVFRSTCQGNVPTIEELEAQSAE